MFEAQIAQISPDELDKMFDSTPDGTPSANTLVTGKEGQVQVQAPTVGDIPFLEDDETDVVKTPEQLAADQLAATEAEEAKKKLDEENKGKTAEELEAIKVAAEEKAKADAEAEDAKPEAAQVTAVLKNTVDYLIKSGQWVDFEGRDDLEITEEVYADLAAKQDQYRVEQAFNELVDTTGAYGKAIIEHIKQGGDPDQVIDIFKEQKQLEAIDTSTEDGKLAVIEKYYKEVVGFKNEKVQKDLKRLITEEGVDAEYNDIKELYDNHYKQKLADVNKERVEAEKVNKQRQAAFVTNIKSALDEDKSLTPVDKKLIASSILDFKHQLDNGQKVNDFYIKFAEIQADPKQYIDLVRYVMDPKNYKAAIASGETTKIAKNTFNFVKGNATVIKTKSPQLELNDQARSSTYKGTDFSSFLQK